MYGQTSEIMYDMPVHRKPNLMTGAATTRAPVRVLEPARFTEEGIFPDPLTTFAMSFIAAVPVTLVGSAILKYIRDR